MATVAGFELSDLGPVERLQGMTHETPFDVALERINDPIEAIGRQEPVDVPAVTSAMVNGMAWALLRGRRSEWHILMSFLDVLSPVLGLSEDAPKRTPAESLPA